MNSSLIVLLGLLCCSAVMAGYTRTYYGTGHKTHLGGAGYGYHPVKYVSSHPHGHGLTYPKPIVHHPAPIVYAHKSYSKPHVTHYIKPAVHPVISKPFYLGGHGHGIGYKPVVYGHAAHPAVYAHKHYHH